MSLTQINKAGLDEIALDHVFTIGASGSSAYTFQGEGLNGTVNNPTLYLTRGKTYRFENGSGGHPIRIQSTSGASGTAYNTGVTNNAGSGTVIVEVQHDAPDVLYYQCTSHAAMNGILYVTGALSDSSVTSAKIADGAIVNVDVNASAAIAGTKISPNFGSQNVVTTGTLGSGDLTVDGTGSVEDVFKISDSAGGQRLLMGNRDSAGIDCPRIFNVGNAALTIGIGDSWSGDGGTLTSQFTIAKNGTITSVGNHDFSNGIDVTGNANISGEVIAGDLAVDGTTLMVDAGNNRVGLGLSNPATPLHVFSSTVNGVATFESGDSLGGIALRDNNTTQPVYLLADGNNFKVDVNASERVRIDNNGHLGLGLSSPNNRLHVYHPTTNQVARFESGDADVSISFKDSATTTTPTIGAAGNVLKLASNGQDRVFLDNNGHLGINLESASNGNVPLLVHHATTNESIRCSSGDEYVHIGFKDSTTNNVPYLGAQGNELRFITGGSERLRINNNGHITMASQPCVMVTNVNSQSNLSTGQNGLPIQYTSTHINQGGISLSNSNSRITVPTTGTYLVTAALSGGVTTVEAGDGIMFRLRRNGANYPTDDSHIINNLGSETGMEFFFNFTMTVNLTANDYIEVSLDNIGSVVRFSQSRGYFGCTLMH